MKETEIQAEIKLALGSLTDSRVFRNNVGFAYSANGSPVRFGLFPGSGDLIGWKTYLIRGEDVGNTVAVFTSVEVKSGNEKPRDNQLLWQKHVLLSGGIAIVVNSKEAALMGVQNWRPSRPAHPILR